MRITKLEHSGLAIEKNGKTLLIDPVEFTEKLPNFNSVVAIIITHKHGDHFQPKVITGIATKNPNVQVFTTEDNAANFEDAEVVKDGDVRTIGEFGLRFFGSDHAAILPGQVPCQNIGVVVDEKIVDPGDSFDTPPTPAEVLLVSISAPWCKIADSIDYVKSVKPKVAIPVHDAVLSELGKGFNNNWLKSTCDEIGAEIAILGPNTGFDLS